jgi:peptidoglycan/LPS O-acetylase OafA/YrhL
MSIASALIARVRPPRVRSETAPNEVVLPVAPDPGHAIDLVEPPTVEAPLVEAPPRLVESAPARAVAIPHNDAIDVVRFFAAAGVVLTHSVESRPMDRWSNLFRFAVPFFLFASLYFQTLSLQRNSDRTLAQYILARFKRLYMPFLAWSLIYLIARDLKRVLIIHYPPVALELGFLWKGTEYHLWFLPFLLVASILLAMVYQFILARNKQSRWVLIALAVGAGVAIAYVPMPASWNETFDNPTYAYVQFWRSLPTVCWAMAFAWLMAIQPAILSVPRGVGLAGIVLACAFLFKQAMQGIGLIPRAFTGLGCMLAALAPWRGPMIATLARLGRYGYGVYLCHVLIVEVIHVFTSRAHLAPSPELDVVNFAISFTGSLALVALLARSRWTAWLNG